VAAAVLRPSKWAMPIRLAKRFLIAFMPESYGHENLSPSTTIWRPIIFRQISGGQAGVASRASARLG